MVLYTLSLFADMESIEMERSGASNTFFFSFVHHRFASYSDF